MSSKYAIVRPNGEVFVECKYPKDMLNMLSANCMDSLESAGYRVKFPNNEVRCMQEAEWILESIMYHNVD